MTRFKFNTEQLKFVEDTPSVWRQLWRIVRFILISLLLSVGYYFILSEVIYTGDNARLQKENKTLRSDYKILQGQLGRVEGAVASLQNRDREIYRSIFKAEPPASVRTKRSVYDYTVNIDTVQDATLVGYMGLCVKEAEEDAKAVSALIDSTLRQLEVLGKSAAAIPSLVPIAKFSPDLVGAALGHKINPFYKSVFAHNGMDILGAIGTEIVASADGVVESVSGKEERSSGNVLVIDHQNGYKTRYANAGGFSVRRGQAVVRGQKLGWIGLSGMSMAPHLHYEVLFNDKPINPVHYLFGSLSPREYVEVVNVSQNTGQSLD